MKTRFKTICALAAVALPLLCGATAARAQTPARAVLTSLGSIGLIVSNMTTNTTSSPFVLFRERPSVITLSAATSGADGLAPLAFLEYTTNRPGDSSTNWFRPVPPTALRFTNNSSLSTQRVAVVVPASSYDGFTMARIFSWQNPSATNNWTNFTAVSSVIP